MGLGLAVAALVKVATHSLRTVLVLEVSAFVYGVNWCLLAYLAQNSAEDEYE